MNNKAIMKWIL